MLGILLIAISYVIREYGCRADDAKSKRRGGAADGLKPRARTRGLASKPPLCKQDVGYPAAPRNDA